jgi:hypothetical protein
MTPLCRGISEVFLVKIGTVSPTKAELDMDRRAGLPKAFFQIGASQAGSAVEA